MRRLEDILNSISTAIESKISLGSNREYYGLTELFTKEEEVYPIVKDEFQQGRQISPDDNYDLQIYYRLNDTETETDFERGFGANPRVTKTYDVTLFGIGNRKFLGDIDSEGVSSLVHEALPSHAENYEFISTGRVNNAFIDIVSSEFAGQNLDHLLIDIIAFSININIQKISC